MSSHILVLFFYLMSGSPVALLLVLHHSRLFILLFELCLWLEGLQADI
jgi:hypothetical protein